MLNLFLTWPERLANEAKISLDEAKILWNEPTEGIFKSILPWVILLAFTFISLMLRFITVPEVFLNIKEFFVNSIFIGGIVWGTYLFMRNKLNIILENIKEKK